MGKRSSKVKQPLLHLSLFDWRVAIGIGFLLGIVVGTAPQYVGLILLIGGVSLALVLVNKGRI